MTTKPVAHSSGNPEGCKPESCNDTPAEDPAPAAETRQGMRWDATELIAEVIHEATLAAESHAIHF